jgi:large subunit ribosomal protein L29
VAALEEVSELLKALWPAQKATQQLTNTSQMSRTRRDIARAKTILAQKKKGALMSEAQTTAAKSQRTGGPRGQRQTQLDRDRAGRAPVTHELYGKIRRRASTTRTTKRVSSRWATWSRSPSRPTPRPRTGGVAAGAKARIVECMPAQGGAIPTVHFTAGRALETGAWPDCFQGEHP